MLIDGRKIKNTLLATMKQEVEALSFSPVFTDIVIGENPASLQYALMKKKNSSSAWIYL